VPVGPELMRPSDASKSVTDELIIAAWSLPVIYVFKIVGKLE
jgi:hypothetical protein